jgi:hypothetical protein
MNDKVCNIGCKVFNERFEENPSELLTAFAIIKELKAAKQGDDTIRISKGYGTSALVTCGEWGTSTLLVGFGKKWLSQYPRFQKRKGFAIIEELHAILERKVNDMASILKKTLEEVTKK